MTLFRLWAVLGDPGCPDGPQTAPQSLHDPPKPRLLMILGPFGEDFRFLFSIVFLQSFVDGRRLQTTQNTSPHHAEHLRHGGGDGPQGSWISTGSCIGIDCMLTNVFSFDVMGV